MTNLINPELTDADHFARKVYHPFRDFEVLVYKIACDVAEEEGLLDVDRVDSHYEEFEFDDEDQELILYFDQDLNESENRQVHKNFFLMHWSELAKWTEGYEKKGTSEWVRIK